WYGWQMVFHLDYDGAENAFFQHCAPDQRQAVAALLAHLLETRTGLLEVDADSALRAHGVWTGCSPSASLRTAVLLFERLLAPRHQGLGCRQVNGAALIGGQIAGHPVDALVVPVHLPGFQLQVALQFTDHLAHPLVTVEGLAV